MTSALQRSIYINQINNKKVKTSSVLIVITLALQLITNYLDLEPTADHTAFCT